MKRQVRTIVTSAYNTDNMLGSLYGLVDVICNNINADAGINIVTPDDIEFIDNGRWYQLHCEVTLLEYMQWRYKVSADIINEYLMDGGFLPDRRVSVFVCGISKDDHTFEEIIDYFINPSNCTYNSSSAASFANSERSGLPPYINHFDSMYENSSTDEWTKVKNELNNEYDEDPLYEGTYAGQYISHILYNVENALGIWSETSVQSGMGVIFIYDEDNNELGYLDYRDYVYEIIDLALQCDSESKFKSDVKELYLDWIE